MDAQPIEQDALLSRAEVAAILCVGPKTVARWAKAGKLNSFRTPGGHRRFLKADVLALMTGVNHSHDRAPLPLADDASASISAGHDGMVPRLAGTRPPRGLTPPAAAAVVAEAVAIALEAQADEAAKAAIVTADAVAAAATTAAEAALAARRARAYAAAVAAETVASDAARTAAAIQLRADDCAAKLAEAASRAAVIVAAASPPGSERESALTALRLAATVKAAAVATAEDTAAAAASVASAVTAAAAGVAFTVSAAAASYESEVAKVAAALQATATATARQVAAETDVRAMDAASLAREAAAAIVRDDTSADNRETAVRQTSGGTDAPVRGGSSPASTAHSTAAPGAASANDRRIMDTRRHPHIARRGRRRQ